MSLSGLEALPSTLQMSSRFGVSLSGLAAPPSMPQMRSSCEVLLSGLTVALANNHSKQQATMEATFTDKHTAHTVICSPQNILLYGYGIGIQ